jgi:hypothetical protein
LYVLAAKVPQRPMPLKVLSLSASTIQLQLFPAKDNGGTIVTSYELFSNDGADGTPITKVTSFDFHVQGFVATISTSTENLTPGLFYQFTYTAINLIGASDASPVLLVPVADIPGSPLPPSVMESSKTSLAV